MADTARWGKYEDYVPVRGERMGAREREHARAQQHAAEEYIRRTAAGGGSTAEEPARLAEIRDRGDLTEAEYQRAEEKLLG
ncbi:hypothetical protein [Streptomyces aidingensis]|uniref:hypothetical protein n=1 Tax=Streptomyces aidingensis TaxID=910347 RepID=UPI000B8063D2|nr:hypothetical protein [Streptomyces aidingensis]